MLIECISNVTIIQNNGNLKLDPAELLLKKNGIHDMQA